MIIQTCNYPEVSNFDRSKKWIDYADNKQILNQIEYQSLYNRFLWEITETVFFRNRINNTFRINDLCYIFCDIGPVSIFV